MCDNTARQGSGNGVDDCSSNGTIAGDQGSTSAGSAKPAAHSAGALLSQMPGGMAEVLNQLDTARQILHTGDAAICRE